MDEKIAAKISTLLEDVFAAGIKEGRELARQDMVRLLSGEPRIQRAKRAAEPQANGAKPPSAPQANGGLDQPIGQALLVLADEHPDGIFPDAIADYVKEHMSADVSVAAIRQTLRQMTLQGKARRLPRGRYAAIDRAPPPGTLFHVNPAQTPAA